MINFITDGEDNVYTTPSLGAVSVVGRAGQYQVWKGVRIYVVRVDGNKAEVLMEERPKNEPQALLRLKHLSGTFDAEVASLLLADIWRNGRRDVVRELTSDGFVSAVISITNWAIDVETAIETVIRLGLEVERCQKCP